MDKSVDSIPANVAVLSTWQVSVRLVLVQLHYQTSERRTGVVHASVVISQLCDHVTKQFNSTFASHLLNSMRKGLTR